jgi:hypothetical protein
MTKLTLSALGKIIAEEMASEIIGVQPLSGPSNHVNLLRMKYGELSVIEEYLESFPSYKAAKEAGDEEGMKIIRDLII